MNTLNFLMKNGEMLKVEEGATLFKEDDVSDHVFIIIDGSADVSKTDNQGNQVKIAVVESGNLIGEMGVFLNSKRSATIVAKTAMSVVKFTNKKFINALPKTPDLTVKLLKSLTEKVNLINQRVADLAMDNTMLILGLYILEQGQPGAATADITLDARLMMKETKLEQRKITAALKSFHQRNLITKLAFSNGHIFTFQVKLPALKTLLKRLNARP